MKFFLVILVPFAGSISAAVLTCKSLLPALLKLAVSQTELLFTLLNATTTTVCTPERLVRS